MAKAQAEMPHVTMNAVNPFLKNKFADLGAVISTMKPILAKHGLSYSQLPYSDGNRIGVTTIIMHSSGEWIESTVSLELADEKGKSAAQVAGSIITYLRRYSLSSAFGLYADEDDDGNKPEKKDPEAVSDELWNRWVELVKRAEKLKVKHPAIERAKVKASKLGEIGAELKASVEAAELQAKAGEQ